MIFRMYRPLIGTIAAIAVAITGFTATPARAGDDDLAAAIAIILGLAVVGSVIKDKRDDRKARNQVYVPPRQVHTPPRQIYRQKPQVQPRPRPQRVNRKLLPQQCLRSIPTRRGQARVFGQRCLEQNYRYVNSLPANCQRQIQTNRGWRYGYGARCLNQYGYQLARR
jgi:hypothetical protein